MIVVRQYPDPPRYWIAETTVDDATRYEARSRSGAPNALARILVAAGIPDAPMRVTQEGLRGHLTWPSFHRAALWTYEEGVAGLRRVRWAPHPRTGSQTEEALARAEGEPV